MHLMGWLPLGAGLAHMDFAEISLKTVEFLPTCSRRDLTLLLQQKLTTNGTKQSKH
jgi:hypothetical protein